MAGEMAKKGYSINADNLDKKMRNMKNRYKTIKLKRHSTGQGQITWDYFADFEDIFENDRTINCGPTISSMNVARPSINLSIQSAYSPVASTNLVASPSVKRYVPPTMQTRNFIHPIMKVSTFSTEYLDLTFANKLFSHENMDSSFFCSSSSSSASSVATESDYTLQSTSPIASSRRQERNKKNREKYDQRKQMLDIESDRVKAIVELKNTIADNNKIQEERNNILKKMLEKM